MSYQDSDEKRYCADCGWPEAEHTSYSTFFCPQFNLPIPTPSAIGCEEGAAPIVEVHINKQETHGREKSQINPGA